MGFHVSTIHNLPIGQIEHFIHTLDMSDGVHARWINKNLHILASSLERNAGLVTGPRDLSEELFRFLTQNLTSDFLAIEGILRSTTCLIISEGHLTKTNKPVYLIPIATHEANEDAHELIEVLLSMIAEALRNNQLKQLVSSLGAQELELSATGGGFLVCNLRRLNNMLELKPNVAGLGVNLNAIIEASLPPETRPI